MNIMFFLFMLFSFLTPSNCFYLWEVPLDVNLTMNTYNSTNCYSNISVHTEFIFQCDNTTLVNTSTGYYHQCCYDILKRLSPIVDPQFNHCYTSPNTNNNNNHYKYLCEKTELYNLTLLQLIIFVFIVVIIMFSIYLIIVCFKKCFQKDRNSYYKIN